MCLDNHMMINSLKLIEGYHAAGPKIKKNGRGALPN